MNIEKIKHVEPVKRISVPDRAKKSMDELVNDMEKEPFGTTRTIYDMCEDSKRRGQGCYETNGLSIDIDTNRHNISLNGVSQNQADAIIVPLTNGYRFCFSLKDVNNVREMLDMFCPEDIRRILSAIAEANYKLKKQAEIEQDLLHMGESASKNKFKKKEKLQKEEKEKRIHEDVLKKMAVNTVSGQCFYNINKDEAAAEKRRKEDFESKIKEEKHQEQKEITEEMVKRLLDEKEYI